MDPAPFAGLMDEEQNMVKVMLAVEAAVLQSFQHDRDRAVIITPRKPTQSSIKDRANICWEIFRVLRGDMRWSWMRIVDHIPRYLRMKLDGQDWEPDARTMWAPNAPIV